MYKITAIVTRPGNVPVTWTRFSEEEMTQAQCEQLLYKITSVKRNCGVSVHIENFQCVRVNSPLE